MIIFLKSRQLSSTHQLSRDSGLRRDIIVKFKEARTPGARSQELLAMAPKRGPTSSLARVKRMNPINGTRNFIHPYGYGHIDKHTRKLLQSHKVKQNDTNKYKMVYIPPPSTLQSPESSVCSCKKTQGMIQTESVSNSRMPGQLCDSRGVFGYKMHQTL
jgi:hypothetical protein